MSYLGYREDTFSKGSPKTRFQRQNFQNFSMEILQNIAKMFLFYMVKSLNKIILLFYLKKKNLRRRFNQTT